MTFPRSINHSQAIKLILQQLESKELAVEKLSLESIAGRIAAESISAPLDVPAFNCSRMDGYAINLQLLQSKEPTSTYQMILGEAIHAQAQTQTQTILCKDQALPIMTGGMLPSDANAIVLKEQGTIKAGQLQFNELPKQNQYIRTVGSDLKKGQVVIKAGQLLSAAQIGLMASLGLSEVMVLKRPKVALMMTGDELINPGKTCLPGQIYDANSLMLSSLLQGMGCEVQLFDSLKDNQNAVSERFQHLSEQNYDVIITVGGVSMGDRDWIPSVLDELGEVVFHKVRIKPGFPMIFGRLGQSFFYGLPGNPVSAYTTMCQYVFPLIQSLNRQNNHHITWRACISHEVNKTHYRREFLRGFYDVDSEGNVQVSICGGQQSSRIESLSAANSFVILNESQHELKAGAVVSLQPFLQFSK